MKKTAEIRICDHCKKNVSNDGEMRIGGSVFTGWYHVEKTNGSTHLSALSEQKNFDFCSDTCLISHFKGSQKD